MSPIFTIIVVILAVLAILDLIVGVSNDAINFLNSALGSKVAKRWVILVVASAGILLGVLTSNGMMEVARNGVFHPGMFSFENIMFLFVAVMLSDVVLLNTFNALGLPTSTTVSLVFELLGASLAVAMFTIWNSPDLSFADLGQYINAGKAMIIISGILSSVVLAFAMGAILMYISRLIFSFKYNRTIRRYGAVWCGISIVGIVYFAIFKGMKSSGLISPEFTLLINEHIGMALLAVWVISSALLWVLQRLGVNIMKITILAGTFALALAFAGNDLVNFIGVPMAGLDSYMIASEANDVGMMMSQLAAALGREDDSRRFAALYDNIKKAFNACYVRGDGVTVAPYKPSRFAPAPDGIRPGDIVEVDTQTSYALPLAFGLFDDSVKDKAVQHLVDDIAEHGNTLTTGFIGTPYLNVVLSENGRGDVAYTLFEQRQYPSWLYPVLQGATTMWERWNSYTLENGFGPVDMNSFNHYAYGAIGEWMFAYSLGIQRDETAPAYRHIILQPEVGGSMSFAKGGFESPYGRVESGWEKTSRGYVYRVTVPANTTATLRLQAPSASSVRVLKGGEGVGPFGMSGDRAVAELKSGSYEFEVEL